MTDVQITIQDLTSTDPTVSAKQITIVGQLDESNIDNKAQEIYKIIEALNPGQKLNIVFDFAGLDYMNSKSIGYMTDFYSKITSNGGKICIAKAKENILDILNVVGLTQLITCYSNIDEAKAYVAS